MADGAMLRRVSAGLGLLAAALLAAPCALAAAATAGTTQPQGSMPGSAIAAPATASAAMAAAMPTSAAPTPQRAVPTAADPALEARMMAIASELRCLVCQNQTIADSHADLAADLREEVRDMLRAGRSADEVRRYMTDRYGDFILYRPPFKPTTFALWLGPALLLAIGMTALIVSLVRRRRLADDRFEPDPALEEADAEGAPAGAETTR